jgi:hypothetical protein
MSLTNRIKARLGMAVAFERNALNEVEVLIHKEARHHAPHGYMLASNRGLGIKNGQVPFVFPDHVEAPVLTQRTLTDLWEAFYSQGWVPHHLLAYGALLTMHEDEHASDDAGYLPHRYEPAPEQALPGVMVDNALLGRLTGQAKPAGLTTLVGSMADRRFDELLDSYKAKLEGLPEDLKETAAIRYDQIVSNGRSKGESFNEISEKLKAAAVHTGELVTQRQLAVVHGARTAEGDHRLGAATH